MTVTRSPVLLTILFIAVTLGGGLLIGLSSRPDGWFEALVKPSFQPPNSLFGPVWTVLYVLIGLAGARIFSIAPSSSAMKVWFAQLVLNFLWSPLFFLAHSLGTAMVVVVALFITILAFIRLAMPMDRLAGWLFVPYALWVGFASLLNGSLIALN